MSKYYYVLKNQNWYWSSNGQWDNKVNRKHFLSEAAARAEGLEAGILFNNSIPTGTKIVRVNVKTKSQVVEERLRKEISSLKKQLEELRSAIKKTLKFEAGDVWRWVDEKEANDHKAEVGTYVFISHPSTYCGSDSVFVRYSSNEEYWLEDAIEGLELVERDGKLVT